MPYKQLGVICSAERAYIPCLVIHLKKLGFRIRALWCPSQDLAIQAASEHEIPFVASQPDEVLLRKEVEMVVIAGKPYLHAQMCIKALGIGKHILCESPAALTQSDAAKMLESSQYYPQILSLVGFGLRNLEVFRHMKEFLTKDYIGVPLLCEIRVHCSPLIGQNFDWLWECDMGGGVLNLVGSHVIDLVSFLLDKRAERVQGLVKTYGRERNLSNGFRKLNADSFASFLLKFKDNFSVTVTLNSLCHVSEFKQEILICGSSGTLTARNENLFGSKFAAKDKEELLYSESHNETDDASEYQASESSSVMPKLYARCFKKVLETLSQALPHYDSSMEKSVASWKEFLPSLGTVAGFEDAQYVRAVIDAVRYSSTRGDWVRVNVDN